MTARRSSLEHDADRRTFDWISEAAQRHAGDERALAEYIGAGLRMRWTWALIGRAIGASPRRAAAIWQRDLVRRGVG